MFLKCSYSNMFDGTILSQIGPIFCAHHGILGCQPICQLNNPNKNRTMVFPNHQGMSNCHHEHGHSSRGMSKIRLL